jgi:hypothetical protein
MEKMIYYRSPKRKRRSTIMDEKARESNRLRQRKFLELHKDEVNAKRREKYHERIGHGKCPRCGSKTKKGRTLCTDCCEYMLNLNRKYAKRNKAVVKPKGRAVAKKALKRTAR